MDKQILTLNYLKERLVYCPETGIFTHKHNFGSRYRIGDRADTPGHAAIKGYRLINLLNQKFLAHRVAWLYVHGRWPERMIDHINGQRGDNRICNLRDVERRVNQENFRVANANNATGALGVMAHKNVFRARLKVHGKTMHLGLFETVEQASNAYIAAKRKFHEGCTI